MSVPHTGLRYQQQHVLSGSVCVISSQTAPQGAVFDRTCRFRRRGRYSATSHISASSNISSSIRCSRSFSVFVQSLFNAFACIGLTFTCASGKSWCTRFVSSLRMISRALANLQHFACHKRVRRTSPFPFYWLDDQYLSWVYNWCQGLAAVLSSWRCGRKVNWSHVEVKVANLLSCQEVSGTLFTAVSCYLMVNSGRD